MNDTARIPDFADKSFDGMLMWFSEMFDQFNDDVYEAAYPFFMKSMDIQLDA